MTESSALRRGRGKPAIARREQFLARVWLMVYEEHVAFGAKNISVACRDIMRRHRLLRLNERAERPEPRIVRTLVATTWEGLRDLYNEAEGLRRHGDVDSFLARFIEAKKPHIDARAPFAKEARLTRERVAWLRHAETVGKKPPTGTEIAEALTA